MGMIITNTTDPAILAEITAKILQSPFLMNSVSLSMLAYFCLITIALEDCDQQAKKIQIDDGLVQHQLTELLPLVDFVESKPLRRDLGTNTDTVPMMMRMKSLEC